MGHYTPHGKDRYSAVKLFEALAFEASRALNCEHIARSQVPYFICIDLLFHDPVVDPFGLLVLVRRHCFWSFMPKVPRAGPRK